MESRSRTLSSFLLLALAITIHHGLFPSALGLNCTSGGFACINCTSFQMCTSNTPSGPVMTCPSATICNVNASFECTLGSCFSCSQEGRFPDPSDATHYFICESNSSGTFDRIVITCSPGLLYNATSQRCDVTVATLYPCVQEGRFPDVTNCSRYYMCNNVNNALVATRYTCPGTSQFKASKMKCVAAGSGCTAIAG